MAPEQCADHVKLVADVAVFGNKLTNIEASQNRIETFFAKHVEEGEKQGGFRDRLIITEREVAEIKEEISALKKAEWKRIIAGGVISGMVIKSPEILSIVKHLFGF